MCDYPILTTKLSDLISSDDELSGPENDGKSSMSLNIGFAESSSNAIDYLQNLKQQSKESGGRKTDSADLKVGKVVQDSAASGVDDSGRTSFDVNHNNSSSFNSVNEQNTHQEQETQGASGDNMSKRFGLLFQKGVRTSKDKLPESKGKSEAVLPHLKSGISLKPEYEESSFIEVDEDHFASDDKSDSLDTPKQGPSASPSTSDESELGARADPIGESSDANMATAISETGLTTTEKATHQEDGKGIQTVKETNESEYKQSDESSKVNNPKTSKIPVTLKVSAHNGDISANCEETRSDAVNKNEDTNDNDGGDEKASTQRSKSDASYHTTRDRGGESDTSSSRGHNDQKTGSSNEEENKKSTKSNLKKDPPKGARPTRSSLLRGKSLPHSDLSSRKMSRAGSLSSDDSGGLFKSSQPPPIDPIPDSNSDFHPYEHWQSLKESQKSEAQTKVAVKKQFSEKYRKHGLPKRAPSVMGSGIPIPKQHHGSTMSISSVATKEEASKNILKPEFNPFGTPSDKYLTPLQQKEKVIKDLQTYVTKLEETVALQDDEIANFQDEKEESLQFLAAEKDAEMDEIYQEVKKLEDDKMDMTDQMKKVEEALEEEKEMVANLHAQIAKMEIEQEEREEKHKQNYFQMYQKGREAQLIEQEEDLVCHAMKNPGNAPNKQLVTRLEKTERQLDKLRQTFRDETYSNVPHMGSDSEAQVELLKSAVFYYLTDCQPDINLSTMLSMLNYSEVQKKNIIRHLDKKKK